MGIMEANIGIPLWVWKRGFPMKKDITFLVLGGISLIISLFDLVPLPFDAAWIAIIFCGVPIIMEAVTGLVLSLIHIYFSNQLLQ